MSNDQKLLVGSDGALYCRVRPAAPPPPTMLYDLETRRVEAGMAVRSSYLPDTASGMQMLAGAPGAVLDTMVASPYAQMGIPPAMGFQPVGPGVGNVMPEMALSAMPMSHPAQLQPGILEAEIAASRSRLREQEALTDSLLAEPGAKRLRLMPLQGGQSPGHPSLPGVGGITALPAAGVVPGVGPMTPYPVAAGLPGVGPFSPNAGMLGSPMGLVPFGQAAHARRVSNISRVFPLYMKSDDMNISPFQCLARKQIEVFEATEEDAGTSAQGRNKPIVPGQVGIRCIHCVKVPRNQRKTGAVYYPNKLGGIYQTSQKMIMGHLMKHCSEIPEETREKLKFYKNQKSSDGGGKRYWGDGVKSLGVYETQNDGLAFKPEI